MSRRRPRGLPGHRGAGDRRVSVSLAAALLALTLFTLVGPSASADAGVCTTPTAQVLLPTSTAVSPSSVMCQIDLTCPFAECDRVTGSISVTGTGLVSGFVADQAGYADPLSASCGPELNACDASDTAHPGFPAGYTYHAYCVAEGELAVNVSATCSVSLDR